MDLAERGHLDGRAATPGLGVVGVGGDGAERGPGAVDLMVADQDIAAVHAGERPHAVMTTWQYGQQVAIDQHGVLRVMKGAVLEALGEMQPDRVDDLVTLVDDRTQRAEGRATQRRGRSRHEARERPRQRDATSDGSTSLEERASFDRHAISPF